MGNSLAACCQLPIDIGEKDNIVQSYSDLQAHPLKSITSGDEKSPEEEAAVEPGSESARKIRPSVMARKVPRHNKSQQSLNDSDTEGGRTHKSTDLKVIGSNELKYANVSADLKEQVEQSVQENPEGAYLMYNPLNNGSWQCLWSKKYKADAWAFCRPKEISSIPNYKFNGKPETLSSGIDSSSEALCSGWLEFFKIGRRVNGTIALLPHFIEPDPNNLFVNLLFALHNVETSMIEEFAFGTEFLTSYENIDAIGVLTGVRGPIILQNLLGQNLTSSQFAQQINRSGVSIVFFE